MITSQDIREKTFEKATFGGYNMNEVDDFLEELADNLAVSQKETATLKGKMKVLAEKVQEYRESEDAMHQALVTAQKVAKNIEEESRAKADALVSEAQAKADEILAAANEEAARITGGIQAKADAETLRYRETRAAALEYIQKIRMLTDSQLTFLNSIQDADLVSSVITPPAPAEKKVLPEAVAASVEEPEEDTPEEEAVSEEEVPAEEEAPAEAEEEAVEEVPAEEPEVAEEEEDFFASFEKAVFGDEPEED